MKVNQKFSTLTKQFFINVVVCFLTLEVNYNVIRRYCQETGFRMTFVISNCTLITYRLKQPFHEPIFEGGMNK